MAEKQIVRARGLRLQDLLSGHPIIQALGGSPPLGRFEDFQWCYVDNAVLIPRKVK